MIKYECERECVDVELKKYPNYTLFRKNFKRKSFKIP